MVVETVDLRVASIDIWDGRPLDQCSKSTQAAASTISAADAVMIFAPTYRASYPGVLKNLLDQLPVAALRSKPVGIVALGASEHHFLGVDWQLRTCSAGSGRSSRPSRSS